MTAPAFSLPTISVVVPSFNQGRYLRQTLDSLFRQDYPGLEVVVMDGGSTDDSVAIIRDYADRLAHWQSGPDGGQSAAINAGVARCRGTLAAWLNSDDYYCDDCLWAVGRAYAAYPDRGLYLGNGLRQDEATGKKTPFTRRHLALNREALRFGLDTLLQPASFFSRAAWEEAGGLNPALHYCMDWDLFLRIAARHPAVTIDEFLAVSREHEATKTGTGRWARVAEIGRMVATHTGRETTPGVALYALATLLDDIPEDELTGVRHHVGGAMAAVADHFTTRFGHADGFPLHGDPQDAVYLPLGPSSGRSAGAEALPTISVIVTCRNEASALAETLESVFDQKYPGLEMILNDGAPEVLERYRDRCTFREPPSGDVVAWLHAGDRLSTDALAAVGRAFAADPNIDLLVGNSLVVHADDPTVFHYGEWPLTFDENGAWRPAPLAPRALFVRRTVLTARPPDERYRHYLAWKMLEATDATAARKLERTLIVSRAERGDAIHHEWYRLARPRWPRRTTRAFWRVWRSYVAAMLRRKEGGRPRRVRFWSRALLIAASAWLGIGNPERF